MNAKAKLEIKEELEANHTKEDNAKFFSNFCKSIIIR